jgi:thiaminase/transcriptional activator TenA
VSRPSGDPHPGSLAQTLWAANADLTRAALAHPFVRGLGDGTLPRRAFQHYVGQDAYFLDAFARAYALALARSPDREGRERFYRLLGGVLDELRLHAGYAAAWGLRLQDVAPAPATLAYTDFLLATATLAGVGETCAAMTPCLRLYAFLGRSLAAGAPPGGAPQAGAAPAIRAGQAPHSHPAPPTGAGPAEEANPYAEWIRTYADPAFAVLAADLEALLDRYAADTPAVRAAYRRAMALEVAFFEASAA